MLACLLTSLGTQCVVVQAFLNGELQIAADEAFVNAVQSYFEEFLKSDRVVALVSSGGSSANDFREVRYVTGFASHHIRDYTQGEVTSQSLWSVGHDTIAIL